MVCVVFAWQTIRDLSVKEDETIAELTRKMQAELGTY
jgi:hypothetical protein